MSQDQKPSSSLSPRDVTQITPESIDLSIRTKIITVFKDVLDGMYSVIEEYEDDPEWSEPYDPEKVIDLEMEEEKEKENEEEEKACGETYIACSTCGKKKQKEDFGYKAAGVLYKSCTDCRNKKKRGYDEVKKGGSTDPCDEKKRKLDAGGSSNEANVGTSTVATAAVGTQDLATTRCVVN